MIFRHAGLVVVASLAVSLGFGPAADRPTRTCHYVVVFGGQRDILRPPTAHVWATYVRAVTQPNGTITVDPVTISWLPVDGRVRPLSWKPEPGRNYSLEETFAYMCGSRQRIAIWGPYEISECRFQQACQQKAQLDSGAIQYKVNDWFDRRAHVEHCMHAVSRAHPDVHEGCWLVRGIGERAAFQVVDNMVKVGMICPTDPKHDWLLPALGLDRHELVRRQPHGF